MTREIKFRAWNTKEKQMYNFATPCFLPHRGIQVCKNRRTDLKVEWLEDWILMQFTGLKDKNGKEIYEGDIVKIGINYEVVWDKYRWGIKKEYRDGVHIVGLTKTNLGYYKNETEVIGNIYENKNLIKETNGI